MILRDVPLYLMETLKHWHLLHGYIIVFMLLTTVRTGSTCKAPSSPQCFRRKVDESIYICEWSMNMTESDVTFDLYFNETKFGGIKMNCSQFNEEQLIRHNPVHIWVEAHAANSSCKSTKRSVVLWQTVKYEVPQNISMSWFKNNLNLSWRAAEKHPALAEVRFRRYEHPTESWENRTTNTSSDNFMYQVIVVNLLKHTAYQVQIRHRSNQAPNPLWSDWSPVMIVPAELEKKPDVTMTKTTVKGSREVILTWKLMPHAATVTGVTYSMRNTQSSHGCPCKWKKIPQIISNKHTIHVSYSAVNISVIARNAAGYSPPAVIQVAAEPAADLKACDKTLLDEKLNRTTCLEFYKLQDGVSMPENIITLTRKGKKQRERIKKTIEDYVRYLYFEHRCDGGRPQTVKMCLFYKKEGVPLSKPQDFNPIGETHSSVYLSWKAIPSVDHQGFLTHYSLCSKKISSQEVCHNISASLIKHRLENLTPGAEYDITLAGVTRAGEGPKATATINTLPEKPVNVLWSLSLLFLFFLITTSCPFILKRIKPKIFPPVPTPVIPDFTCNESQEMLERKEVVHELTLYQLHPEGKSVPEDTEETTVHGGEWDDGTDEDVENGRCDSRMSGGSSDERLSPSSADKALTSSREVEMTDLEQLDNEIAMLIYRNGLVFDVKTDTH